MVDDMGIADVGCFGNKSLPTPNVDRLCKVEVVSLPKSSKMTYPTLQGGFSSSKQFKNDLSYNARKVFLLQIVPK